MQSIRKILQIPSLYRSKSEMSELEKDALLLSIAGEIESEEQVLSVTRGFLGTRYSVLVATDKRLVWRTSGFLAKKTFQIPYKSIQHANCINQLFTSDILIKSDHQRYRLRLAPRQHATQMLEIIAQAIDQHATRQNDLQPIVL